MSNKSEVITLPFWETLRRSFVHVFSNWRLCLAVSAPWFALLIYEAIAGFPAICTLKDPDCVQQWQYKVSSLLFTLAVFGIVITYCRAVILKAPLNYLTAGFTKQLLLYVWYSLLLVAMVAIPTVAAVYLFALLLAFINAPESAIYIVWLMPVVIFIYAARFLLVFPAIAVDNRQKVGFKASFKMTRGNANKIFWGQLFMMLPAGIISLILSLGYSFFAFSGFVSQLIFIALIYATSFFDACLKASFLSHLYQYFVFYYDQQKDN